jgi:hypothetical protein
MNVKKEEIQDNQGRDSRASGGTAHDHYLAFCVNGFLLKLLGEDAQAPGRVWDVLTAF